jgi:ferritin-like metal-binding protein YciE
MKISTLEEAFIHELSDIYNAEKQLTKALPKLAKAATNEMLTEGFETHLTETEEQVARIEQIIASDGIQLKRVKCRAMEGLIEEGKEIIAEIEAGPVRDAMLIAAAQKVEHYEIAGYGCLVELAKKLGYKNAAKLLATTLEEEKATDEKLNDLAITEVNDEAMQIAA